MRSLALTLLLLATPTLAGEPSVINLSCDGELITGEEQKEPVKKVGLVAVLAGAGYAITEITVHQSLFFREVLVRSLALTLLLLATAATSKADGIFRRSKPSGLTLAHFSDGRICSPRSWTISMI